MRTRLILGVVVVSALLIPQAASAFCMMQPFDRVVRSSDTVLVATVADAVPRGHHQTGITVRLDVEQVLKGSAEDGQSVWISSCGPIVAGQGAESMAQGMIGQRGLFLLSKDGYGTFSQYSEITTPQGMTLDQKITRARDVLGVADVAPPTRVAGGGASWWPWAVLALGIVALVAILILKRRRPHPA